MVLHDSLDLFILQVANFTINLVFLSLFICRFVILRSFSKTDRYKDYFPKLRIFFSVVYVVINIALLIQTLMYNVFDYTAVDMVLVSLGEGIDSIILVIQLLVLRLELLKEQPYTPYHIAYFIYLVVFSVARLVIFLLNQKEKYDIFNISLSAILILDSSAQLFYWVVKKQSLPQFKIPTNAEIDELKHHSRLIQNFYDPEKSLKKKSQDNFPYIMPFVSVQNGRIKIILEITSSQPEEFNFQELLGSDKKEPRATKSQNTIKDENNSNKEILSSGYYSLEEIKNLYIIISRFPITKSMDFSVINASLPSMAKELQQFLAELFKEKQWYQPNILKYLKIPIDKMKDYSEAIEKYSNFNKATDLDQTLGVKLQDDKNAIFYSVSVYKHLWVYDHYEFYIKVSNKGGDNPSYPIKRFSQFQDFHIGLKNKIKALDKDLMLPLLPKKHLFHWNQDQQINQRRSQLEKYLRLLYNDYTIVSVPQLKQLLTDFLGIQDQLPSSGIFQHNFYEQLKIVKGQISKSLIKNDLVTYYQFKLYQHGVQISTINKRFSQFQELHQELQRWMNNIQITYKMIALPERVYFKSQSNRQEKLKNYLQNIVEIHDIGKVYAVNSFFNIQGNQPQEISQIVSVSNQRKPQRSHHSNNVINEVIELTENIQRPTDRFSLSSQTSNRRFNERMNNLDQD